MQICKCHLYIEKNCVLNNIIDNYGNLLAAVHDLQPVFHFDCDYMNVAKMVHVVILMQPIDFPYLYWLHNDSDLLYSNV